MNPFYLSLTLIAVIATNLGTLFLTKAITQNTVDYANEQTAVALENRNLYKESFKACTSWNVKTFPMVTSTIDIPPNALKIHIRSRAVDNENVGWTFKPKK